ncbi:MAG: hypothetical protein HY777_07400 [Betaproteobacteria bacterium]|nr:hypothetical protein [Betaproteobacteria bacterium]
MRNALITVAAIFVIMAIGIIVDRLYRRFAARNPQLGPFRKEKPGCGACSGGSGCGGGHCGP